MSSDPNFRHFDFIQINWIFGDQSTLLFLNVPKVTNFQRKMACLVRPARNFTAELLVIKYRFLDNPYTATDGS